MDIVISGTVGVGKSTISNDLFEKFKNADIKNINLIKEIVSENPYLDFYYKNQVEWSFITQLDFLRNRFKSLILNSDSNKINIYDRHFLDDYVFSTLPEIKNHMSGFEFNIYNWTNGEYLNKILNDNKKPKYFFLLKSDLNTILSRIKTRGILLEQKESLNSYWKSLYNHYYENPKIIDYFIKNSQNFFVIDATIKKEEIVNKIYKIIKKGIFDENSYKWNYRSREEYRGQ